MAAFINNDITTAGLLVLAKGVAGEQIKYTRIVLGDGYLPEGQTPRTLTGVVSPKAVVNITKCEVVGDGTVAVGGVFTNDQTDGGFYYRELGLYAEDPDEGIGEILYCYGNCGELAEWIPPTGSSTVVEKTIDIITAIGTAANVTAQIPADAYATREECMTCRAIALGAQATADEALGLAQQAIKDAAAAAKKADTAIKTAEAASDAITKYTSTIHAVPSQSGTLTYTGGEQSPEWDNYNPVSLQLGGTTTGTAAGTYDATFTPQEGYQWAEGGNAAKTVQWSIGRASTSIPVQSGTLTYNGKSQSPSWTGYEADKVTLAGTTSGTDAGSYNAEFTPKENYQFSDGTTAMRTVAWKIGKAPGSLTLDRSAVTISGGATEVTVNATREGDGVVSAVSDHTEYATVAVTGTAIRITGVKNGSAIVTVSVKEGKNHLAPANKTIAVTVNLTDPDLSKNTPAAIKEAAQSGQAKNLWSEGDKVPIEFTGGKVGSLVLDGTYYAFIIGFDHNASFEGNNTIHFQFGKDASGKDIAFVDSYYGEAKGVNSFYINPSSKAKGGWEGCYMRTAICEQFFAVLPKDWQNVITACTKYSDNVGNGEDVAENVTSTQDRIWLLSNFEVFGKDDGFSNAAEQNYQKQYDYYKNGNSAIKYKHNDTSTACRWWLRSAYMGYTYIFGIVSKDGVYNTEHMYFPSGFAPGFKVS